MDICMSFPTDLTNHPPLAQLHNGSLHTNDMSEPQTDYSENCLIDLNPVDDIKSSKIQNLESSSTLVDIFHGETPQVGNAAEGIQIQSGNGDFGEMLSQNGMEKTADEFKDQNRIMLETDPVLEKAAAANQLAAVGQQNVNNCSLLDTAFVADNSLLEKNLIGDETFKTDVNSINSQSISESKQNEENEKRSTGDAQQDQKIPPATEKTKSLIASKEKTQTTSNQMTRPKSSTTKIAAKPPTKIATTQKPSAIPACQQQRPKAETPRAVSMDRAKNPRSGLPSPRTPSSAGPAKEQITGLFEPTKMRSPCEEHAGSTASTPRSSVSASHKSSDTPRSQVKSKIGSFDNAKHVPGGGNVTIMSQKVDITKVTSKCGSKDNMKHTPRGGDKKIESRKLEWKVESKIGSLENAKHRPGGGEKKIETAKLEWKVSSKIGSLENAQHTPGGGTKKIETVKLDFKDKAQPKVGSKDNIGHKPGGGDKKIETQKLNFKETAQPRIDATLKTERIEEEREEVEND